MATAALQLGHEHYRKPVEPALFDGPSMLLHIPFMRAGHPHAQSAEPSGIVFFCNLQIPSPAADAFHIVCGNWNLPSSNIDDGNVICG